MIQEITILNALGEQQTTAQIVCKSDLSTKPLVSIVMTFYNTSVFLKKAIESVLEQTLENIELICVDDGSTDNTLAFLKEYALKDKRITVLTQKNAGAGIARNAGLTIAKGDWISFLDSDDFFQKDMLESMLALGCKDDSDVVVCGHYFCNMEGEVFKQKKYQEKCLKASPFAPTIFKSNIYSLIQPNAWTKLFKTSLVRQNQVFFENLKSCNDYTFSYTMLAAAKKISITDKPFVYYRVNTGTNISSNRGNKASCIIHAVFALKRNLENLKAESTFHQALIKNAISCFKWELSQCSKQQRQAFFEELALMPDKKFVNLLLFKLCPLTAFKIFWKNIFHKS